MADAELRVVGTLVRNPDLRFTAGGKPVCELVIATNHRYKPSGGSGWTTEDVGLFTDIVVFGDMAERAAQSFEKGDRVMAWGRLKPEEWTNNDGVKQRVVKLMADEVGASIRWNPVEITRNERTRVAEDPIYGDEAAL